MKLGVACFLTLCSFTVSAQVNTNFTQFFINPFLYNPSYAGADAQSALFFSYRNQWTGFEGAPTIANFSFHTPAGRNVGLGLNFTNEEKGILSTNEAKLALSYSLPLGDNNFLRFGISGGSAFNGTNLEEFDDVSDPALAEVLDNNMYLVGNAGISLQLKTFNLGFSVPNLFTEQYVSQDGFSVGEIAPLEQILISASNRFYFANGRHVFEPIVIYRYSNILPAQIEIAPVIHLNHVLWFGGSYKQDFGISAFGGLKVKQQLGIGYSYSLANSGVNEMNSPTHEVHLSLLLGKKNKDRIAYSFIHTEKEKKKPVRRPVVAKKPDPVKEVEKPKEEVVEEVEETTEPVLPATDEGRENEIIPEVEKDSVPEEPEVITPIEKPAEKPVERHLYTKKGNHALELGGGSYVIVGAFSNYANAEKYSDDLFIKGYPTRFGYSSEKSLWYVYLFQSGNLSEVRAERDKARQSKLFAEAWVLTVEE